MPHAPTGSQGENSDLRGDFNHPDRRVILNDTVTIMKISRIALLLVLGTVGVQAHADESPSTDSASKAPIEQYAYGTTLDIDKVITVTELADQCGPVPVQMTYEDSHGQRHVLEYQVMGTGCSNG